MAKRAYFLFPLIAAPLLAGGISAIGAESGKSRAAIHRQVRLMAELGHDLFFDPALSASGRQSCASCHDPAHGFGPPDGMAVRPGGVDMQRMGVRAVPSLRYLQATPQFAEHFHDSDDEGDASVDNGPTGGLAWDGRADRGRLQAKLPLLAANEMANKDEAAIVATVRKATYAGKLRAAFGDRILDDNARAFDAILQAIEAFEQSPQDFFPYDSKYDSYLAGRTQLTPQEARGLALFNEPSKGNCTHCHASERGADGTPPQFTDYGFAAIGLPRNREIPANADSAYFDRGLCGPYRSDFKDRAAYCGLFKTPSLRNVATRQVFFHNGVFHTLREAVAFYAERDTNPEKWYPRAADGTILKYDDLPPQYRVNVNVEPPFDRHLGDKPPLSDAEIDDIVAFLGTLTDGYKP